MRISNRVAAVLGYGILLFGVGFSIYRVEDNIHSQTVSRVTTVSQRCDLTELVLSEATRPQNVVRLRKSLKGCRAQLRTLEKQAGTKPKKS